MQEVRKRLFGKNPDTTYIVKNNGLLQMQSVYLRQMHRELLSESNFHKIVWNRKRYKQITQQGIELINL